MQMYISEWKFDNMILQQADIPLYQECLHRIVDITEEGYCSYDTVRCNVRIFVSEYKLSVTWR